MAQSERRIYGIYPTPQPLIDYIVRSVQILLRSADPQAREFQYRIGAYRGGF